MTGLRIAAGKTAGKAPLLAEKISLDPISQGIEPKVGDPEHPPGRVQEMPAENVKFCPEIQIDHRKVGRREDEGHHILKTDIG